MVHSGITPEKKPKKQKQVTGSKAKLKVLADLKKVNAEIKTFHKAADKRFAKMDKLFTAQRKAEEKLGIR